MSTNTPDITKAETFSEPLHDPDQLREQAESAAREILENVEEYGQVIKAIREKRPMSEIIKEIGDATAEGGQDLKVLLPAIRNTTSALRDGASTSEFKMFSGVNKVLTFVAIMAPTIEGLLAAYQSHLGENPSFGASMFITGISIFLKTFISDRYNKSRTLIKQAAAELPFEIEEVRHTHG